ncbi:phospholipase D family protein [Paracidovorax citrulli]
MSTAPLDTGDTALGRAMSAQLAAHPGQSVFHPLTSGTDAFAARIALARAAERTLDLQYYIFEADNTGRTLLAEALAAADRGVRVRLLLDDLHTAGTDPTLLAVDSHPNVELRVFNPFANRQARGLDFISDFSRVDRRMHNKSMTADNQITIVGGRNIGNAYFSADSAADFSDLDLLAGGPVARHVSEVFDDYWNSESAYPIATLAAAHNAESLDQARLALRRELEQHVATETGSPYTRELLESGVATALRERRLRVVWAEASVIADRASKVLLPREDNSTHAIPLLFHYLDSAERELILVSPYFVPGRQAMQWLTSLPSRGVHVRILTNSWETTDVSAVHAGYAPARVPLLRAGVSLYELKPSAYQQMPLERDRKTILSRSRASLHTKAYMVDRKLLFVGSLNLDPRSARLNTEMGIVVHSPELCNWLAERLDTLLPDVAYRVDLGMPEENGYTSLRWVTREQGEPKTYDSEPGLGVLDSISVNLLRLLPIREEL